MNNAKGHVSVHIEQHVELQMSPQLQPCDDLATLRKGRKLLGFCCCTFREQVMGLATRQ